MTADSAVVIITSQFPFGVGEDFIAGELPALQAQFDRVLIAPLANKTEQMRQLPEGVELVEPDRLAASKMRPTVAFSAARQAVVAARAEAARSAKIAAFSAAWVASATRQARALEASLRRALTPNTKVVFYGYWLARHAAIAAELKRAWPGPAVAVSRAHGGDVFEDRAARGFLPGRRYLARRLDKVFSISQAGANTLAQAGFKPQQVSVARLGVAATSVRPPASVSEPWCLASCSNAAAVKRLDFLAQVVAALRERGRAVHWVHIGDSAAGEFDLAREVTRLGIDEDVTLVGPVPNPAVRAKLADRGAHLFLNVSSSEGVPVTIMEAFSMGLPVLATAVGGTGELVRDGKEGALISIDHSADEVARRVEDLLTQSPESYRQMRRAALARWEQLAHAGTNYPDFAAQLARLLH